MRTTIDLPDALFRRAKAAAAQAGSSLRDLVVRALEAQLAGPARAAGYRFEWRGVNPGPGAAALLEDVLADRDRTWVRRAVRARRRA
jgi:hypothetical protein